MADAADYQKGYDAGLLARADAMLEMYRRRQTTDVPGTVSLIRDLTAALRGQVEASARIALLEEIIDRLLEGWEPMPPDFPVCWVRGDDGQAFTPEEARWFIDRVRRRESVL